MATPNVVDINAQWVEMLKSEMNAVASAGTEKVETPAEPEPPLLKPAKEVDTKGKHKLSKLFGIRVPKGFPDPMLHIFEREDWGDMCAHIPDVDPHYKFQPRALVELAIGLELGDNVWISGATGSGKTTLVEQFCALVRRPFIRINGRGDMESGAIFGQYIVKDGTMEWKDGACTEAVRKGALFCQDEPTVLPPEIAMGYQWLLENNGKLFLADYAGTAEEKLVHPHKEFRFVCCDNTRGLGDDDGSFAGTNVWNTATLDRFSTTTHLDYLKPSHEEAIIKAKAERITPKLAKMMVQVAGLVREAYKNGDLSFTMSPRTLLSWAWKIEYYGEIDDALRVAFYEKLGTDEERKILERIYETAFGERFSKK